MLNKDPANNSIEVCAAVILENGRYLLTRRLERSPCALLWEFPGGKRHPGEGLMECLSRELQEELGIEASVGKHIVTLSHSYAEYHVILHFFWCTRLKGDPKPLDCKEFRWVPPSDFHKLDFPAADASFLCLLNSIHPVS